MLDLSLRLGLVVFVGTFGVTTVSGCSGTDEAPGSNSAGGNPVVGSSGTNATGGTVSTSTNGGAGATSAQGGATSSGGKSATGGTMSSSGGSTAPIGGVSATGGTSTGGKATGGAATAGAGGGSTGGTKATGGNPATGGSGSSCTPWPAAKGTTPLTATRVISGSFDGGMMRFTGWGGTQEENQDPLFELANNATLQNVIIGAPAGDGIHCLGNCTLKNVWWEDVGEDAATLRGSSSSQVMTIDCAGAKSASDKIFQHNGPGTMIIKNFWAQTFGKIYRSCGNCSTQYERHVILSNIVASSGSAIAGINTNYKDTASFWNVNAGGATLCQRYTGNNTGDEPVMTGSGIDGTYCINLTTAP